LAVIMPFKNSDMAVVATDLPEFCCREMQTLCHQSKPSVVFLGIPGLSGNNIRRIRFSCQQDPWQWCPASPGQFPISKLPPFGL
jgi:hypothetical protein